MDGELKQEIVNEMAQQAQLAFEVVDAVFNKDTCELIANAQKRLLCAYLSGGFSREEAFSLLLSSNLFGKKDGK